jgi:hypothetical protein
MGKGEGQDSEHHNGNEGYILDFTDSLSNKSVRNIYQKYNSPLSFWH